MPDPPHQADDRGCHEGGVLALEVWESESAPAGLLQAAAKDGDKAEGGEVGGRSLRYQRRVDSKPSRAKIRLMNP